MAADIILGILWFLVGLWSVWLLGVLVIVAHHFGLFYMILRNKDQRKGARRLRVMKRKIRGSWREMLKRRVDNHYKKVSDKKIEDLTSLCLRLGYNKDDIHEMIEKEGLLDGR